MKQVVVIVAVILVSCSPQRRLARLLDRYPLPMDTVIVDSIIYKSDTVSVYIPGETVRDTVYIPEYRDMPDTSLKTASTFAEASAGITSGILWLELIQTDTMVVYEKDSIIVEKIVEKTITTTVPEYIKLNSFWRSGFLVLAGLILIGLVLFFLLRR